MRRMSSLPIAESCPRATTIGKGVESSNALRSTIFHKYCESGEWPEASLIDEKDLEEIKTWFVPKKYKLELDGKEYILDYADAVKEERVSLDYDCEPVGGTGGMSVEEVSKLEHVMTSGSFDMGYHFPDDSLVVVEDIKSSIFAVSARTKSLQLHAYGIAYAKSLGAERYVVGIWDASQGKHYFGDVIELGSFEALEYEQRIKDAGTKESESFIKGSHCSQCWVRTNCPAHLEGVPDTTTYRIMRDGATHEDARHALVEAKRLEDQSKVIADAAKNWINLHGPCPSEDGSKKYGAIVSGGRKSLDREAVKRALGVKDLSGFQKVGKDITSFRWTNR